MATVYWNYYHNRDEKWFDLTLIEPIPALPEIIKARDASHITHFTKCPAFKDYYKNVYVIKSPVDIEIYYDKITRRLSISPQDQDFYEANIIYRGNDIGINDDFLMSISLNYLFIADEDCQLELIPASMHKSEFVDKTRIINGTFNINKWYRPVEVAFEIKNSNPSLKIKRGDALAYVRFIPAKDEKIALKQKVFSSDVLSAVKSCLYIKDSFNKTPLKTLYQLNERVRKALGLNKSKCPFNWRNK